MGKLSASQQFYQVSVDAIVRSANLKLEILNREFDSQIHDLCAVCDHVFTKQIVHHTGYSFETLTCAKCQFTRQRMFAQSRDSVEYTPYEDYYPTHAKGTIRFG